MGVIELKQSQVKSITSGSSAPGSPGAASIGAQAVQSLQASMANNEGIMSSIRMLQDDPDMQAVLSDPEVMRAIQNLDLKALANNPKIIKLMNNSHVQNIQGKVN